ncbi:MAG: hypothetical protein WB676_14580 [Bryobacteraceae bacterium]
MKSSCWMRVLEAGAISILLVAASLAQAPEGTAQPAQNGFKRLGTPDSGNSTYVIAPGTHILLSMINSVSTKQAAVGDKIYLATAFPVLSSGRIVIPQGSWVLGTVTEVKRPGRVRGRGELHVRFDTLTLPNGVTRDFRAGIGAMDGRSTEKVNKEEGKITSPGNKAGDAATIGEAAGAGAGIGSIAGASAGHWGMGAGIGGAAGAAAGLAGVLLTRGPDATLSKGTTMEMVLDRPLSFNSTETDFRNSPPGAALTEGSGPEQQQQTQRRRLPLPWPL